MRLVYRYIMKYVAFTVVPMLLFVGATAYAFIFAGSINNSLVELTFSIVISSVVFVCFLLYYGYNILRFLSMIKRQNKKYKVSFDDKNATNIGSIFSTRVICSDNWLICPGKIAIYYKELKSASMGECYYSRGGAVYPVKIKILSGKTYNIKFKSEADARFLRKWARK
ncbi:MAG: hypothetical protein E7593_04945 [Ruminococcaceae bacterium]|nr:hypothetical protein [Oscillospiraceae bacterium]